MAHQSHVVSKSTENIGPAQVWDFTRSSGCIPGALRRMLQAPDNVMAHCQLSVESMGGDHRLACCHQYSLSL